MVDAQRHRGPDDAGMSTDDLAEVTFGHSRLSIIDCTERGRQPMRSKSGRLRITFNGEIYNHAALRRQLEAEGHAFSSNSDTEVILAAYETWGLDAVSRLVGMFAFAIHDARPAPGAPELLLVRDGLGIKPLVYATQNDVLYFASEMRALIAAGCVRPQVDPAGLADFLAFGAPMQPRTIVRNVEMLPPGHMMLVTGTNRSIRQYWDLHRETAGLRRELASVDFDAATSRIRSLLVEAAESNAVADVPIGAFLSGGLDSTVVAGLLRQTTTGRMKTFSVVFPNDPAIDEGSSARSVAGQLGSEHHEVDISDDVIARSFDRFAYAIDQPSIDGMNTWLVSAAAKAELKVAWSGLGADEIFGGYPHFQLLVSGGEPRSPRRLRKSARRIARALHEYRPSRFTWRMAVRSFPALQGVAFCRSVLPAHDFEKAVNADLLERMRTDHASLYSQAARPDADVVQQVSYAEVRTYLCSTLLRDVDAASMAHGLEVRPVLLHRPLVELVYSLPQRLKSGCYSKKALLRSAAGGFCPPRTELPLKRGFSLPVTRWMSRPLKKRFHELLSTPAAHQVFSNQYLSYLAHELGADRPPTVLWGWGTLLSWAEQVGVSF